MKNEIELTKKENSISKERNNNIFSCLLCKSDNIVISKDIRILVNPCDSININKGTFNKKTTRIYSVLDNGYFLIKCNDCKFEKEIDTKTNYNIAAGSNSNKEKLYESVQNNPKNGTYLKNR